ncbi:uncharacterized protein LOC111203913 [Brassica napus]|uniref:uncharacterized protein LOC111203913 n=1 Tax=Brassica napus TaxID=3708 RepID=UPI0020799EDF|nr:uncharacterized protein LOC111203913 [Brassica napus]
MNLLEKDSVHRFVKKVLEASRLNWTNIMARCNEETSLLNEFSHGDHNKDLIHETLRRFDWGLLCCDTPRTLDQIIETDVVKPSSLWSGFGGEAEGGSSQAQIASEKVKKGRNA